MPGAIAAMTEASAMRVSVFVYFLFCVLEAFTCIYLRWQMCLAANMYS